MVEPISIVSFVGSFEKKRERAIELAQGGIFVGSKREKQKVLSYRAEAREGKNNNQLKNQKTYRTYF